MRAVVTGGEGFVGKRLVSSLRDAGLDVVSLDLESGVDLTEWAEISSVTDFSYLFHLAARSFVPSSFEKPREFYRANIQSTLNVLELCRVNSATCIYTSSYVYGAPQYLPIDEKHQTVAHNPYAQSKIMGEELCSAYARDFGLSVQIIRPFNIYGPGQRNDFLIPSIIRQAGKGKVCLKDPRPCRDFVYVDDVVKAYQSCMSTDLSNAQIFNIGSGYSTSIGELVNIIQKYYKDIDISFSGEQRKNEVLDTVADITRARSVLGWEPSVSIEEGLRRIVNCE